MKLKKSRPTYPVEPNTLADISIPNWLILSTKSKDFLLHDSSPLFNREYWSVYKRISHNIPRTTNFVESWHNSFGKNLKKHPIVYSLVNSLRQEQLNNENKYIKIKTGEKLSRLNKYVLMDERLKNIIADYDQERND
jgi:hypothetical protein